MSDDDDVRDEAGAGKAFDEAVQHVGVQVQGRLAPAAEEAMRGLLRNVFPDPRIEIADALVRAAVAALPVTLQVSLFGEALSAVLDIPMPEARTGSILGYYEVTARHVRKGVSAFAGRVPMVRVRVPDTQLDIPTEIGIVYAGDHFLYTMDQIREELSGRLGWEPASAEWITPARLFGARFAAVATLVLRDESGRIRGYVLEAGMATGERMVRFLADELDRPIFRRSWYQPTPFAHDDQRYTGLATFAGDEPRELSIAVSEPGLEPHLEIEARYERVDIPSRVWPTKLTAEAALRVAAIAEKLGRDVPGVGILLPALAAAGRALDWEQAP